MTRDADPRRRPGVEAVALNLTTVDPRAPGFLTAYDCDHRGRRSATTTTPATRSSPTPRSCRVSADRRGLRVRRNVATNLVVDITGRFGDRRRRSPTPLERLVDTRTDGAPAAGRSTPLPVAVGDGAARRRAERHRRRRRRHRAGCGRRRATRPTRRRRVNVDDAAPVPNMAVVVPGADGTICVTSSVATHLIVDRFVTFAPGASVDVVDAAAGARHP